MTNEDAADILDFLSVGCDPSTGDTLKPDSVIFQDVVIEALQAGARALRCVRTTNQPSPKPVRTTTRPPLKPVPPDHPLHGRRYQDATLMDIVDDIKSSHPDHIVFVQCGYFLEVYGEDAVVCSEIFGWKIAGGNSRFEEHTGVPAGAFRFKQRLEDDGLSYVLVGQGDPSERLVIEVFTAGEVFPDSGPYQHPETILAFADLNALDAYRDKPSRPARKSDQSSRSIEYEEFELTPQQEAMYLQLKQWRSKKAQEEGIPVYVISHNSVMKRMVILPVTCTADLLTIKGFGEKRTLKYGEEILAVFSQTIGQDDNIP